MIKILSIIFTIVVTSFYFFPFEFTFLPGVNTKMAMAGLGLVIFGIQLGKSRNQLIDKDIFVLSIFALIVSLAGLISVVVNGTHDYTYASYVISMWVWLSGAYVTILLMKKVHGNASIILVCNYLIAVCAIQCAIAMMIDNIPIVKTFVDSFLGGTEGYMGKHETRLYGIGAALDVAGSRFSLALVLIAFLLMQVDKDIFKYKVVYIILFFFISIVGNMMSRTTTVGIILSILYWLYMSTVYNRKISYNYGYIWRWFVGGLIIFLPILIYLYNNDTNFYHNIRFAFEGFFSLAESGTWDVSSNEILKNMYVFPDNLKTWVIGDGYFDNPYYTEMYYTGPRWGGYYMATDVGYLRFIFYFGVVGLVAFVSYFIKVMDVCVRRFPQYRVIFILFILVNFIVWFKVATDIFLVFAIFLCIDKEENEQYDALVESKA